MRVLNFGSLNIDRVYAVPHFVRPGESLAVADFVQHAGGKGLNMSLALARAGAPVAHAGKIGNDGDFLRDLLAEAGVDVGHLMQDPAAAGGHAIIQVNAAGENAILVAGGTNQRITPEERRVVLADFQAGDFLLIQNEINDVADLICEGADRGLQVVAVPAPFTDAIKSWPLDQIQTLIFNEIEGEELTGETEPRAICDAIAAKGISRAILTLGSRGVVCLDQGEFFEQPAERVEPVDTTAAGDCFTGYWLASVLAGMDTPVALKRAVKAGAICVTRHGAAPSIPYAHEVD